MLIALLSVPLAGAGLLAVAPARAARAIHAVTALLTALAALAVAAAASRPVSLTALDGLLRADALSGWLTGLIGLVAALAAMEAPRYVAAVPRTFYPLFHLFVFTMLLAVNTDDVGVLWVAVEGTTLASVFLVNFERTRASLEASYKYLLICSVGIALAFIGTVLMYFADVQQFGDLPHALRWTSLVDVAPALPAGVVNLAFVFIMIGYGTKAGLVPMHTWLPDAHSEAPAPVSALMSGVLLSVGVYAVLRFKTVVDVAAGPAFAQQILLGLGLLSMALAAAFLWTPTNYKRMLAYSSVEHIGLVCLGLGFGGTWGVTGAVLHIANHALAKCVLFLLAGRIRTAYGSATIADVRGLLTAMPRTGRVFLAAMLALMGVPPFGLFVSEVMILVAGFQAGLGSVAVIALSLLVVAFGGLLRALHLMLYGDAPVPRPVEAMRWSPAIPFAAALLLLLVTGLAWPPGLAAVLDRIALVVR
jgi:hydrogenase-4 component F